MTPLDAHSPHETSLIQIVDELADATPGSAAAVALVHRVEELCRALVDEGEADAAFRECAGASALIEAYAEEWAEHRDVAERRVGALALPAGHPSMWIWQAVMRCARIPALSFESKPVVIFREQRLAACTAIPEDPSWYRLGAGEDWEVAFSEDHHGQAGFVVAGVEDPRRVSFIHSDTTMFPQATPFGLFCPARSGSWEIRVDGMVIEVQVS